MRTTTLTNLPRGLARIVLSLLTCTYIGAYRYHTRDPINKIHCCQNKTLKRELIEALVDFRRLKDEELAFVAKAAALSAAAVIGVFSWPATENTMWAAKMLWNWSFFLSTFSLVGSAPTRLLQHLPANVDADLSEEKIQCALNLFLHPIPKSTSSRPVMKDRRISRRMLWAWQCPAMLMSYSWVFFLVGYTLHVLTPVFDRSQAHDPWKVSVVTVCGCGLIAFNFVFCAAMCQYRLQNGTVFEWICNLSKGSEDLDTKMGSRV